MKTSQLRNAIALTSIGLLTLSALTADASLVNIAQNKPVVGGSGSWPNNPYNASGDAGHGAGEFNAQQVTTDPGTGSILEGGGTVNYWLGRDGGGPDYLVIDLLAPFEIAQFDLFNTGNLDHNGAGDRSTMDFRIYGANAVAPGPPLSGDDLVGATLLASGSLAFQFSPLTAQTFYSSSAGPYRYIRFNADNAVPGHASSVGLNEIRIFANVPEPSTLMLLGMGLSALVFWRRSRYV